MSTFQGERHDLGPLLIRDDGTSNPFVIKNSAGTTVATIDNTGTMTLGGTTSTNGSWTIATGKTLTVTDADALTVGGIIVPQHNQISTELLAASVDKWIFVAPWACKVTAIKEVHSVVGSTNAAVSARKVTSASTEAPGATASSTCKELTTAAVDLTATINVVQTPTLSATAGDYTLAAGDKIGLDFSGTLTGLVGSLTLSIKRV